MNRAELEHLSRDELITIIFHLQAELETLRQRIEHLEAPPPPPPISQNSAQPPSQDQKANRSADTPRKKPGPPTGHPKHERQIVPHPDEIVAVRPPYCPTCQIDLAGQIGCVLDWTQITELPEPQAQVIEVRQVAVTCPGCGVSHTEEPPSGLELHRQFGARLEATIVYYRHEQHMSYERTQAALLNLHGVTISQGGIDQVMQRAGAAAEAQLPALLQEMRASAVINSDETSVRVTGQTWWHWVFCACTVVVHVIRTTRGFALIALVLLLISQPNVLLSSLDGVTEFGLIQRNEAKTLLFMIAIASIWFGIFNAAREIAREVPIFVRERLVNLRIGAYLTSKMVVLGLVALVQSAVFMLILMIGIEFPTDTGVLLPQLPIVELFITVLLSSLASTALGLLVSASLGTPNRALSIVPLILIVQIVFAGLIFEIKGPLQVLSWLTISRWSLDALGTSIHLKELCYLPNFDGTLACVAPASTRQEPDAFLPNAFIHEPSHLLLCWGVLGAYMVLFLGLTAWQLKRYKKQF